MNHPHPFAVVLPAAGTGNRFGGGDKLLVDLAGRTVLQRSLALFASRDDVQRIVVVTGNDRMETYRRHLLSQLPNAEKLEFVAGGDHRWQSVLNGLRHLAATSNAATTAVPPFVAIHDAARPLCLPEVIDEAFRETVERGAALPCVPEPATLKRRSCEGNVAETVDRSGLFQAQTPQCFTLMRLISGYEALLTQSRVADLTDDAQVYERMGWPVAITAGSVLNMKITTQADVELALAILAGTKTQLVRPNPVVRQPF